MKKSPKDSSIHPTVKKMQLSNFEQFFCQKLSVLPNKSNFYYKTFIIINKRFIIIKTSFIYHFLYTVWIKEVNLKYGCQKVIQIEYLKNK